MQSARCTPLRQNRRSVIVEMSSLEDNQMVLQHKRELRSHPRQFLHQVCQNTHGTRDEQLSGYFLSDNGVILKRATISKSRQGSNIPQVMTVTQDAQYESNSGARHNDTYNRATYNNTDNNMNTHTRRNIPTKYYREYNGSNNRYYSQHRPHISDGSLATYNNEQCRDTGADRVLLDNT